MRRPSASRRCGPHFSFPYSQSQLSLFAQCHPLQTLTPFSAALSYTVTHSKHRLAGAKWAMAGVNETGMTDLPEEILTKVFSAVTDTRTRNSLSLVCRSFLKLERKTRTSLTLRGNVFDLHRIPTSFRHVTHLDLSLLSPWGYELFRTDSESQLPTDSKPQLLALRLRRAFPHVASLTLYALLPITLHLLLLSWPELRRVKLVRWHERPLTSFGSEFDGLFEHCRSLTSLDLSSFYDWSTWNLLSALKSNPVTTASLRRLNLLTASLKEGIKSVEIQDITRACPNLEHLLLACTFDPKHSECVGDKTLLAIASNCPKLTLLHLGDTASLSNLRGDPEDTGVDARISGAAMVEFFCGLPLLEELVLDVCKNVRDSCFLLEVLGTKCPKLRVLQLRQFQWICLAIGSQLHGVALCQGLQSLSISNCADLTDKGLIVIARGCSRLVKFHVQGCKGITEKGLKALACLLRRTLTDVKISCCLNLDASACLRALEPIRGRVERLHVDCVWSGLKETDVDLNNLEEPCSSNLNDEFIDCPGSVELEGTSQNKRQRCSYSSSSEVENGYRCSRNWDRLRCLSLWIGVCDLLTPLPMAGLEDCPNLEEIRIRVEGDCKGKPEQPESGFGLSTLACYPKLYKMQLDCGDATGALFATPGHMDLSKLERFVLNGIGTLSLYELDYWPPRGKGSRFRIISKPAAALLEECHTLRKLFIHGSAEEYFMDSFLKIPHLRDIQLREDYYPAPDCDLRSGTRVKYTCYDEDELIKRRVCD